MRIWFFAVTFVLLFGVNVSIASSAPPPGFQSTQVVASGLQGPTGFGIAPDGRIFILERTGKIHVYKNNQLLAQPFTELPSAATGDRGLTGIAFDPDFDSNKYVYFYYTGQDLINRLVRFNASTDIGTDMTVIYETQSPSFELHIGGTIAFGPDGKLYISIGDNGVSTNAQDLSNPHGKILRINKDGTIPTDNPFFNQSGVRKEIWAYGFRNPFRFQFDNATGKIFVGEVGDATWEEVNLVEKGANYGWPNCEGICNNPMYTDPIYTYNHDGQSSAVVVGPVYRGAMFPSEYQGKVFIGDYARGFMRTLQDVDGEYQVQDFDTTAGSVVDMKEAGDGSIYYITYIPGRLYRLTYSTDSSVPVAVATSDITGGTEPLTVQFSSDGSSDPDGDSLQFLWNFGDGTTSTEANPSKTYIQKGSYTVELTVSDGENISTATPIIIQVGIPPTIHIGTPSNESTYKAGDTIFYSASATDSAGFDLHDGNFTTEVIFHHGDHIHPFLGPLAGHKSGEFQIPRSGEPDVDQWYEIKISVKDANGLTSTESVFIYPEVVNITLHSSSGGFDVLLNGVRHTTPYTFPSVKGYEHILSVPVIQTWQGEEYQFHHWNDGGRTQHTIQTPTENTTYVAFFEKTPFFIGRYYTGREFGSGVVLVREDRTINFNWGFGSPVPSFPEDQFSVRWTKQQHFSAGRYVFSTITDDGVRLYINGNLVIDEWHNQSPTRHNKIINLEEGEYEIVMEYFEDGGGAMAAFEYELALDQSVGSPSFSYLSEYWNYDPGTFPVVPNREADLRTSNGEIYFNWGAGSPSESINPDHFIARFSGTKTFAEGTYRFSVTADDGFRLIIDGETVLDKWIDQAPSTYTVNKHLELGSHEIVIEYYEKTGGAVMEFSYGQVADEEPPQDGQGLIAEYFDNADFTGTSVKKIDPVVDFNWGAGSPDESLDSDSFSARWTGTLEVPVSGDYTFYTVADDGVRLWINEVLVIDQWHDSAPNEYFSPPITLTTGNRYEITMEYYENGGGATAKLLWSGPNITKQVIPLDYLFPGELPLEPQEGFIGEFWTFSGSPVIPETPPILTRTDSTVNFNWRGESPDPVLPADFFVARWTKQEVFEAGNYQFKVTADDGVRIYIDGELLLDQWNDQPPTTYTIEKIMSEGMHEVIIEYYEKTGGAVCEVQYNKI